MSEETSAESISEKADELLAEAKQEGLIEGYMAGFGDATKIALTNLSQILDRNQGNKLTPEVGIGIVTMLQSTIEERMKRQNGNNNSDS